MLKKNIKLCGYQRGGWSPGSKHEKHMTLNPTLFLYRFPGSHGPGPYTMKYWWTLGCFPTGLDAPFRLKEFLATYKQQHVPIEVEEWLDCFLNDPLQELTAAIEELLDLLENCTTAEQTKGYVAYEPSILHLSNALVKIKSQLGVRIPPIGIRAALAHKLSHSKLIDDLYDYKEAIMINGSTPHRRFARKSFEETDSMEHQILPDKVNTISNEVGSVVGNFVSIPEKTADDELKLIRLLTTFAEGCALRNEFDDSFLLLIDSLPFAHDDISRSVVHCNVSKAALLDGKFKEAEFHGREAALLLSNTKRTDSSAPNAYRLWATAVAYQDNFSHSLNIINDALTLHPDNHELESLRQQVIFLNESYGKMNPRLMGKRHHFKSQQDRALIEGSGRVFDNEFDLVKFGTKLYPAKMNPSTNEMGSVFRRVGDLGGFISTSRSTELL
ncbi:unnamed protein product [Phytomonas sp. Hart1]|nr:unnamed protein product [Phytomonas sp. Hart1]|eukprot:CCW66334.1 unnamed protein product [Phytomonas sp. isolate Hart1]